MKMTWENPTKLFTWAARLACGKTGHPKKQTNVLCPIKGALNPRSVALVVLKDMFPLKEVEHEC